MTMPLALLTLWLAANPPLKPCGDDASARALFDELDAAAERTDAAKVSKTWARLLEHPCFALTLAENARTPDAEHVDAFAAWWEAGGKDWLHSALSDGEFTVVPPDEPRPVEPSKLGGLSRLQCAADAPASCARESAGWVLRATDQFSPRFDVRENDTGNAERTCAAEAKSAKKNARYRAWLDCLERLRPLGATLPFGRFRAPTDGWLVLRGRRGHYSFCDEVRAYDLKTGAAWVAKSCSGLVLQRGGSVNHDATDAQRALEVIAGRVPVEALREAAWVTLLEDHVRDHTQTSAWYVRRPKWLERELHPDDTVSGSFGFNLGFSSAQTQLAWSWQGEDGLRESGSLTWPNSSSAAESYADSLWRIAEAALDDGCSPARLPAKLVVGGTAGVSRLDAAPGSLRSAETRLLEALYAAKPTACQVP